MSMMAMFRSECLGGGFSYSAGCFCLSSPSIRENTVLSQPVYLTLCQWLVSSVVERCLGRGDFDVDKPTRYGNDSAACRTARIMQISNRVSLAPLIIRR